MRVYVVVGVLKGVVSEVKGFIDRTQAETEATGLMREYDIVLGYEELSENDVQLHELDIDAQPISVLIRRQIW